MEEINDITPSMSEEQCLEALEILKVAEKRIFNKIKNRMIKLSKDKKLAVATDKELKETFGTTHKKNGSYNDKKIINDRSDMIPTYENNHIGAGIK